VRKSAPVVLLLAALAAGAAGFGMYRVLSRRPDPGAGPAGGGDVRTISKGEPVNLRDHLVPGKYTLFDYYADWCPPCRELEPRLEELARRHPNVAVRKIDIVDWSHPVAEQQGVHDLPYLRLYDPEGRLIREGEATFIDLDRLLESGLLSASH
jgi:thiol-disulfide isomerase/thioredoxin